MNNVYKSGFVTLIGRPNVGKSTLMNQLIGMKIAITSNKPQTTRNRIQTVYTSEKGQIIFLDTPGIHKAKNKLGEYMVTVAERTLNEVDVILWLVEPTTYIGAGEQHIAEQLANTKTPVILVINKIDTDYVMTSFTGYATKEVKLAGPVLYTYAKDSSTVIAAYSVNEKPAEDSVTYAYAVKAGDTSKYGTTWTFAIDGEQVPVLVKDGEKVEADHIYKLTSSTNNTYTVTEFKGEGVLVLAKANSSS